MQLTNINNEVTTVADGEHLDQLLHNLPRLGEFSACCLGAETGTGELWLHFNAKLVYLHFFTKTDGSHAGFQPDPTNGDHPCDGLESVPFLQIGGDWADKIEMPIETTVSVELAFQAAKEFVATGTLPTCVCWFEL